MTQETINMLAGLFAGLMLFFLALSTAYFMFFSDLPDKIIDLYRDKTNN